MQRRNVDKFHAILPLPRVVHPASTAPMRRIFFSKTQFASAIYPLRRRAYGPASAFSRVRQVLRDPHPIRIRTHQSRVGRPRKTQPPRVGGAHRASHSPVAVVSGVQARGAGITAAPELS
jgi:hypothetical protein